MRFRVSTLFGLALPLAACAHSESAADRHFAELSDAMGKMQADQDRSDHMGLGVEETGDRPRPDRRAARATVTPRSISIGDEDSGESDDPNDPSERPEIRLQGAGGPSARPLRGKSAHRGEARIEAADEGSHDGAARASILDPDARKAYDAALALATSRQYERALEALSAFLVKYPDHPYAENALYWRGECYFARGEFLRAAEQFEAVLARFGGGKKAADSLLKIGVSHERLGSPERAREYYDRLQREYPRSEAAKKIPQSNESSARGAGPKENR